VIAGFLNHQQYQVSSNLSCKTIFLDSKAHPFLVKQPGKETLKKEEVFSNSCHIVNYYTPED